jgi:golgi phosphoprotein 3
MGVGGKGASKAVVLLAGGRSVVSMTTNHSGCSAGLPELWLHEEATLLALAEEKGTIETGSWYPFVAAGAVLAELMLRERVRIQTEAEAKATGTWYSRKPRLVVTDPTPVGDALIDSWLLQISEAEKLKPAGDWLSKIANSRGIQAAATARLVELGILEQQKDKVLWVFNRVRYPEKDGAPEEEIRRRLERAIFEDDEEVHARTIVLLSLTKNGEFLPKLFDKQRLKTRKQHLDKLIAGEELGAATAELIEAIQVAIIVTIAASTSVAVTS